jgi:hypothetical protein
VLLEAIVALAILSSAGIALVSLAAESARAVERAHAAERVLHDGDAFFAAVTLWPREDLDRHLGDRHQGRWLMRVDRPRPDLYVISLSDSAHHAEFLRTSVYRVEPKRATP